MALYRIDVAAFDVPADWRDQSITAFRLPAGPEGGDASFVVTRDDGKGVDPFVAYYDKQRKICAESLPDFVELKSEMINVQERDAAWFEFTWSKDTMTLQLRQIYVDCGLFVLIFTLTSTPRDQPLFERPWHALMSSIVFDRLDTTTKFPAR